MFSENAADQHGKLPDSLYQAGISQVSSSRVLQYQYDLKQMRPLSIWWVILILASMAILLGPVDYFVLKRLDRLPLTWLTSIGWIAVFTVGAYYGVQALRGGQMQIRTVSVQDSIAGSGTGWATHYLGIFAPRSDDYQLDGLVPPQWWSGLASSEGQMYARQGSLVTRQLSCRQMDGGNLPFSLPINIWTVQSLVGEMPSQEALFKATVERTGDTAVIDIANTSGRSIRMGFILFQDGYADIPPLAAGASQRFERSIQAFSPWSDGQAAVGQAQNYRQVYYGPHPPGLPVYPPGVPGPVTGAFLSPGCFHRTLAMHSYLQHGAALVCVELQSDSPPFRVKGRSYEAASVQWARQVVLPKSAQKESDHD